MMAGVDPAYDAIVVGSGACGGWAAKELTESGLRVAVLDAGPLFSVSSGPVTSQARAATRQPIQSRCYALNENTSHLFVDDIDNPYTFPESSPFWWIRSRQVGGRLHTWRWVCPRMSDYEFKAASRDGVGTDWPISHADLAPFYDRVEDYLGVYGVPAGLPGMPDGRFVEPPPMSAGEKSFKSAVESRWTTRHVTGLRIAGRSPEGTLAAAMSTGRLTLRPNSIVRAVTVDRKTGRASGVAIVDRVTGEHRELKGRVVVLCASAIESTRILLNSATADHPAGLANSSGVLGHYLMDHVFGVGLDGVAPRLRGDPDDHNSLGAMMPAFRNIEEGDVDFVRGYEVTLQVSSPPVRGDLREKLRLRRRGGNFVLRTFGEVLPAFENRVTLDGSRTDAWGIPSVRIVCDYGENERRMAADAYRCLREMADAAGFHVTKAYPDPAPPGLSTHELGTARMGSDPTSSVVGPYNQTWDVENLFVTDGACFTSAGYQNPTLTMMAITVRACHHLVSLLKRGDL
jgi:choline dehydrogenase-like flavoprotein